MREVVFPDLLVSACACGSLGWGWGWGKVTPSVFEVTLAKEAETVS